MKWLIFLTVSAVISVSSYSKLRPAIKPVHLSGHAQGTTYHITYYAADSIVRSTQVDSIFRSLDSSLSLYKTYSAVSRFNKSQRGIEADAHICRVVDKAKEINRLSGEVFDITIYPLTEAWGFGVKKTTAPPGHRVIKKLMHCVDSRLIECRGDSLIKQKACIQIDPNGIAQGYSADVIASYLEQQGIGNYLAEIGGEMRIKGKKPGQQSFKISIETPGEDGWSFYAEPKIAAAENGAITTSGSYRKFHESGRKKISHILDARTGKPATNELISVTVYAKDAITADAWDNTLMAMGLKKAFITCSRLKEIEAYFIYRKKDGSIADTATSGFPFQK